jgi:hypothetical protein
MSHRSQRAARHLDAIAAQPAPRASAKAAGGRARAVRSLVADVDLAAADVALVAPTGREEVIFLLHAGAEVEHALMVQYLYAAWSLPALPADAPEARARAAILQVAREEMAHLLALQNVLRFVRGPLNLEREDFPFRSDLYPFPFQLEPVSARVLARFVLAEMPESPRCDPRLIERARELAGTEGAVNRVGELYARVLGVLRDGRRLPSSELAAGNSGQAHPRDWRSDIGYGPMFIRQVASRGQAVALVDDIARQGEGEGDVRHSHFQVFVELFERELRTPHRVLALPTNPIILDEGATVPETFHPLADPVARAWANAHDRLYGLLLALLTTATLQPSAVASDAIALASLSTMRALSGAAARLVQLPSGTAGLLAAPPFEMPFTLAVPDAPPERLAWIRQLAAPVAAQLASLAGLPGDDGAVAQGLAASLVEVLGLITEGGVQ